MKRSRDTVRRWRSCEALSLFSRMAKLTPLDEFSKILDCGINPNIYLYNLDERTSTRVTKSQVYWPTEYVLSLHRKHVLQSNTPELNTFQSSLSNWWHRTNWRKTLEDRPNNTYWTISSKSRRARPSISDGGYHQNILSTIYSEIFDSATKKLSNFRNVIDVRPSPFATWGLRLLRESDFGVFPTDKDSGYAIVTPRSRIHEVPLSRMKPPWYKEAIVTSDLLCGWTESYTKSVKLVCDTKHPIDRYEELRDENMQQHRDLLRALKSGLSSTPWSLVAQMNNTIKTHKKPRLCCSP